ncbi:PREDICTED: uncharacterized protein LOC107345838 isoform X1 [Acropora digitifera]|uniref:uncharacterized protein LOC107345838 isoform X1 n=1 Tax=Acropora digitifera TaxID=70779 RepID=UPI00077B0BFD|nr:PREDICTED: uncharacterized protein LOC107345838 isoform X1 [Acropora digitifera]
MLNMQLVQIALHIVTISVMTVEETCGGKTCWFHKKTRAGEECRGRMKRITPGIARFLCGDTNSWACTRHWTRVHREVNSFCACPLPVHSTELSQRHIPVRLYQIFDRIGVTVPGYRAGVRWCNSCSKTADEKFKSERDYSPPEKRASYSASQTSNTTTSSSKQVMQLNHFRGNKYTVHMFNILKLSRFQQPREQLEKQLKEMSSRNELLEAELGKANNQIQLLTASSFEELLGRFQLALYRHYNSGGSPIYEPDDMEHF